MAGYRKVRALARGLDVLRALNDHPAASAAEISAATGIHRTTVHRLLETLRSEGFVHLSPSDEALYRLSRKVRGLSTGFTAELQVLEKAAEVLPAVVREVQWPCDMAMLDGDAMVVRESTHELSPWSPYRRQIGTRWPVLGSSIGRAYLAWCSENEREYLIAKLAASELPGNRRARDRGYVDWLVERTRRNGYAESFLEADSRIAAIALPVRAGEGGALLGCINLIFFASALKPEEAAQRFLPVLHRAAETLEGGIRH